MVGDPSKETQEVREDPTATTASQEEPIELSPASELELERKRNEELLNRLKYLQAEFENYRKRVSREAEAVVRLANEALVVRLMPVLDDLDAALQHLDGEAAKGVHMVRENLLKALRDAGLEEIPAEGQTFDPYVHECVQQVPDPELEEDTVAEVVRKGYRLQDRILRPAQVIVIKNRGETHV